MADAFAVLAGVGLGAIVVLFLRGESRSILASPGGLETAIGRFCGFVGSYLMLIMVVLIARIPWLERTIGQDRLVRWHRKVGPWPLWLISVHVVFVLLGYSKLYGTNMVHQLWTFITTYPDMLAALVAYGLLMTAGLTSIQIARRRLRYETWWIVHLYLYLALALALAHQLRTGLYFITNSFNEWAWIAIWALAAALVITFRIGLPIARNLRHGLRIAAVREEAPGVFSVICVGKTLERLPVAGGQFLQWRFLTRELWWHAHPYSLSALPWPPYLRFTVKAVGDQSDAISRLRPGTRVLVEGPYGAFTHHVRKSNHLALIGAGVGVTPLRALLEDLPDNVDVSVIVRASAETDLVHHNELRALVDERNGRYHVLIGPRANVRLDAEALQRLIPDIATRDIYICGPQPFSVNITAAAETLGSDPNRIHHEVFSF